MVAFANCTTARLVHLPLTACDQSEQLLSDQVACSLMRYALQ